MIKGHFIRLGDKTTCGGEVLEADRGVMMFGIAHAREGDAVSCGKDGKRYTIKGGVSYIRSNGRQVAGHLDSYSGCPCKAELTPSYFAASYESSQSAAPQASRTDAQPASHSDRSVTTNSQLADSKFAETTTISSLVDPAACNHPDQMEELASYIAGEMNRNIKHPAVLKMKELINYDSSAEAKKFLELPWYAKLAGLPNFNAIALTKKLEAMAIWTKQVGQNMEWDHKPKLEAMYNGVVHHKQGKYEYFYDIWSNIHYGYVGIVGGLSESILLDGAGAEQIASDTVRKGVELLRKPEKERKLLGPRPTANPWTQLRSWDDVADRVSISIGMKLAHRHPNGGVTAKMIMNEVLAIAPEDWGDGVRAHDCK